MIRFVLVSTLIACALAALPKIPKRHYGPGGKVVNGFDLDIEEAPYQVSIQYNGGPHFCGGSLISPDVVLTAAHCVEDDPRPGTIIIYAGSSDRLVGGQRRAAKNIIYHENYDPKEIFNDVALIRLRRPFEYSDKIQPATLSSSDPAPGSIGLASGWGKLDENDPDEKPAPRHLQGVELDIISLEDCRRAYGSAAIQDSNLCAYTPDKDTCQGDSGGPLDVDGILVGVVSWGAGCAQRGAPGVYASVAAYSDWISETIKRL